MHYPIEALAEGIEAGFHGSEPVLEPIFKPLESIVDLSESIVDLFEAVVDLVEPDVEVGAQRCDVLAGGEFAALCCGQVCHERVRVVGADQISERIVEAWRLASEVVIFNDLVGPRG